MLPAPSRRSPTPFFVPSYLRGSFCADTAARKYAEWKAKQEEVAAAVLGPNTTSTPSGQPATVPRGIVHDVVERPASLSEDAHVQPWPAQWSSHAKHANLDISVHGRVVRQLTAARNGHHDEGGAVRAVAPAPSEAGLYYYEVQVVHGYVVAVGFATDKPALVRLPGWEPESWAYHTDDGRLYDGNSQGKDYGPKCVPGDWIGAGINFNNSTAFFTKNGIRLNDVSPNIKLDKAYFPIVGLKKVGDWVKTNFGQDQFQFNIDGEYRKHTEKLLKPFRTVEGTDASALPEETNSLHKLVQDYLSHCGYAGTAKAYASEGVELEVGVEDGQSPGVSPIEQKEDHDMVNRQIIRTAVLDGDIDKALKRTRAVYPKVLDEPPEAYRTLEFKLKCRKFIEVIGKIRDLQSKRTASGVESMDVDDGPRSAEDVAAREHDEKTCALEKEALEYGRTLRDQYGQQESEEVRQALKDAFALLALSHEKDLGTLEGLLARRRQRAELAEELNSAIQESQGKPAESSLERLISHISACLDVTAEGGGLGAFINVRRDFLQSRNRPRRMGRSLDNLGLEARNEDHRNYS